MYYPWKAPTVTLPARGSCLDLFASVMSHEMSNSAMTIQRSYCLLEEKFVRRRTSCTVQYINDHCESQSVLKLHS